jgi:hypothetical protein
VSTPKFFGDKERIKIIKNDIGPLLIIEIHYDAKIGRRYLLMAINPFEITLKWMILETFPEFWGSRNTLKLSEIVLNLYTTSKFNMVSFVVLHTFK